MKYYTFNCEFYNTTCDILIEKGSAGFKHADDTISIFPIQVSFFPQFKLCVLRLQLLIQKTIFKAMLLYNY